jgi:hypothetical protein
VRASRALAVIAFPAVLAFCGRTDVGPGACPSGGAPVGTVNGGVTWSESCGVITARNTRIELRWDASSGALLGIANVATGTDFLGGAAHASWAAAVDPTTTDVFAAQAAIAAGATTLAGFRATALSGGGFTFDLAFAPSGPVTVVQHVTLLDDDPLSHWTTDVSVAPGAPATAIEVSSPYVLGVAQQPGEKLVWPWHEGVVYDPPDPSLLVLAYPAPASMQWMELFTPGRSNGAGGEGLYYAVRDASGAYKEIRFGDAPRQMAVAFYPFVTSGHTYTTPPVDLGVAPEGGWYWGADQYRAFLASSGMRRTLPDVVRTMRGWHKGYDRWPQIPPGIGYRPADLTYCEIPTLGMPPDYTARSGLSLFLVYGWHFDGQDSFFPDYDFLADAKPGATCLQQADMTSALVSLSARPQPNRMMFYINAHLADTASRWMQDPSNAASAAKKADGSPFVETTTDWPQRRYLAMCPSAPKWQEQLDATAMRVRTLAPAGSGAIGVYWDQLEEMPSVLCYDRSHGHATPATAFPEGYRTLLTRLDDDFSLHGADREYVFAAEGANDFYSEFIDVAAGMPGRLFGNRLSPGDPCGGIAYPCGNAVHAPEVGRYTMFAKALGLSNFGAACADTDRFARAFLMADPLRTNPLFKPPVPPETGAAYCDEAANTRAFPRYANIYASEPAIYFDGTYKDANGLALSVDATQAMGTVIVGAGGDRLAVQLWNETGQALTVTVTVDLARLGLKATANAALADLDGDPPPQLTVEGGSARFGVVVPPRDVRAIKLSL